MLAVVSSHAPIGIEGELVLVEVDIRRGLPGIDVVGLRMAPCGNQKSG